MDMLKDIYERMRVAIAEAFDQGYQLGVASVKPAEPMPIPAPMPAEDVQKIIDEKVKDAALKARNEVFEKLMPMLEAWAEADKKDDVIRDEMLAMMKAGTLPAPEPTPVPEPVPMPEPIPAPPVEQPAPVEPQPEPAPVEPEPMPAPEVPAEPQPEVPVEAQPEVPADPTPVEEPAPTPVEPEPAPELPTEPVEGTEGEDTGAPV